MLAWIRKAEQKFGPDPNQNSSIGDALEALGMKTEALESIGAA